MLTMYTFKIQHFIITLFYVVVFRYEIIIEENKIYFSTFSEKNENFIAINCITLRPPRSFHYIDDTRGAAHSCAAGHTTYDKPLQCTMNIDIIINIYKLKSDNKLVWTSTAQD